jgi:predicted membrane protein
LSLNFTKMIIACVSADTGGGDVNVVLPNHANNLNVMAKSGAGNVTVEMSESTMGSNTIDAKSGAGNVAVYIPNKISAKIYATSGLGKKIIDTRFEKVDGNTYQSPEFNRANDKVEVKVHSGIGNVSVGQNEN